MAMLFVMRYLEDLDQSEPARKVLKSEALTRMLTSGDGPGSGTEKA